MCRFDGGYHITTAGSRNPQHSVGVTLPFIPSFRMGDGVARGVAIFYLVILYCMIDIVIASKNFEGSVK